MASDDESVMPNKMSVKLDSDPPRLTVKDKKAKKAELEFVFRSEVRSLKAISRHLLLPVRKMTLD